MKIILASNSPRRKEILKEFGYKFSVVKSEYEERANSFSGVETVLTFAKGKAQDVFSRIDTEDSLVIGADTVVCFNGKILGKPQNKAEAKATLKALSGKTHTVYTGFAVISDKSKAFGYDSSEVTFNTLSEELIENYVATGKPFDKAGSYGIQDGFPLVKSVKGSVYNVIGLPIEKLKPVIDVIISKKY